MENMKLLVTTLVIFFSTDIFSYANDITITSPDGKIVAVVSTNKINELVYSVEVHGHPFIKNFPVGITVNKTVLGENVFISSITRGHQNENKHSFRANELTSNAYNFAIVHLQNGKIPLSCSLELRLFNDGIAFRYVIPSKDSLLVAGEASSWKIPEHSTVWYQQNTDYYEGLYYAGSADSLAGKNIGPPVTFLTPDHFL